MYANKLVKLFITTKPKNFIMNQNNPELGSKMVKIDLKICFSHFLTEPSYQ